MMNFLKIVSVYVGAFFQLSAHVWPIFDCYSNMPLFVYRIRDVILELMCSTNLNLDNLNGSKTDIL
jgi:hypothetical protein